MHWSYTATCFSQFTWRSSGSQ